MGHEVLRIQEDETPWAKCAGQTIDWGAELFLWTTTWSWSRHNFAEGFVGLQRIEAAGIVTAGFHLDLIIGLARERQMDKDPFWSLMHLFTADGSHPDEFKKRGINHTWIRPGAYEPECVPGTFDPQLEIDVCFVGSYRYHPEWPYRAKLIRWLLSTYGERFRLYPEPGQPGVRGQRLNNLYASAKVIVGDTAAIGNRENYFSDRPFETLGRGGFLIHPYVQGLERDFTDKEHLLFYQYENFDQLKQLIDSSLEDETMRRDVARRGQAHVRKYHTYRHRMHEMLRHLMLRESRLRAGDRLDFPLLQTRPGTTDETVIRECFEENVYRVHLGDVSQTGIVLDIGANIGAFSAYVLNLSRKSRVWAVEPQPDNFACLARNLSPWRDRVTKLPFAVGETEGTTGIHGEGGGAHTGGEGEVAVRTLGHLLADLDDIDVMKVDIEGAEYALFRGATFDDLRKIRYICMEFHPPEDPRLLGEMLTKIAQTHQLWMVGRPDVGGMVFARRY